jgi:hypothetical protein
MVEIGYTHVAILALEFLFQVFGSMAETIVHMALPESIFLKPVWQVCPCCSYYNQRVAVLGQEKAYWWCAVGFSSVCQRLDVPFAGARFR